MLSPTNTAVTKAAAKKKKKARKKLPRAEATAKAKERRLAAAKAFRFSMILLFTTQVETTGVVPNLDCQSIFESRFTFLASFCIRMTIEMRTLV